MNRRNIAALAAGALAVAAALLVLPVRAAASGQDRPSPRVGGDFLAGYDTGLYRVQADGSSSTALWSGGEVRRILRTPAGVYLLTSKGVVFGAATPDAFPSAFEDRSAGLPSKTYKLVTGGAKAFLRETQDLKDLEADPADPARLLTCTKDEVFLSEDCGLSWKDLGQPVATTGLKAVAFGPYPGTAEQGIWASHPIKGLFVRKLAGNTAWIPVSTGLDCIPGTTTTEEIADLIALPATDQRGPVFLASGSFLPRIYQWDPAARAFRAAYDRGDDFGTLEALSAEPGGRLRFVTAGGVRSLDLATGKAGPDDAAAAAVSVAADANKALQLLSLSFPEPGRGPHAWSGLSELWLASFVDRKPHRAAAENHQALYLQTGFVVRPETRAKYLDLMAARGLDGLVIDMKDDNGKLRFTPRSPLLQKLGRVTSPLDVEAFVQEAKARGVWLIARIPVFKDQVLYNAAGGKYAVWDSAAKAPWQGYRTVKRTVEAPSTVSPTASGSPAAGAVPQSAPQAGQPAPKPQVVTQRENIEEYWVDPYSEEVWAYNVAIANEIVARGFDEVQFDYIRFPTDGDNIDQAGFRWRDPGMDKESALSSFLRYARENVDAPVSIDIYGANGWFRSGVRTGQDVELLAKYVDVICPMYYPSHFEQGFLAQAPAEERPYRIYRFGNLRTDVIARGRVAVRPYVQAFYMNVSYDRVYYNLDYVKREVAGVRDSLNLGMTFWNNAGRYDDVPVLRKGELGKLAPPAQAGLLD